MNINNSQIPHSPTESSSENNENEPNIDHLLFAEIRTTSQTPLISFNMTNMIPSQRPIITNQSEHNNRSSRREAQRRRRQRQRQRRREERQALRQQQIQEQRQQQHQQLMRQYHQQRQQERYIRWADHIRPWGLELIQRWQESLLQWELPQNRPRQNYHNNELYRSDPLEEPIDKIYNEPLLGAYTWKMMDPKERWEQEQINEIEKIHVVDPSEQLTFIQDELEQLHQIDHIERLKEEEEQIQLEQWEQDQSTELNDPPILAYISQLEDDIEQLRQTDTIQTMDNEILED
ncbi:unnamed protein product [Adineta steineri]|uniref:Uncharacterized protein n=1 Tax=Adineta steineri TaxID=433720 RepID=A0A815RGI9_9BILA|nr:unnamed protein product [Adineta steineri]CAF1477274.1 unnamed protein product [Adineta steineri]